MCGRFATGLIAGAEETADWLGLDASGPQHWPEPRWNIAPTDPIPIVRGAKPGARRVDTARWGLIPRWWKKPLAEMKASTFNARSEEAAGKPMFRDAWRHGRCLIPAIGYYEWTGKKGDKTPWFIRVETNAPGFCMAGLWAAPVIDGERMLTATVLTTAAGRATQDLHPRSPVILAEDEWAPWLAGAEDAESDPAAGAGPGGRGAPAPAAAGAALAALMHPAPDGRVRVHEVARDVNRVGNEGAGLIEPVGLGL